MKIISLEERKQLLLDILQKVDRFCRENSINYSLAYGTLLGAVRHRGYIPWDDDIDIAMLRSDYERFSKLFNKEKDVCRFYDCRNDKDVHIGFGKVVDTRTIVIEGARTKNLGIAIDVFPIDNLADTYEESLNYYKSYGFLKELLITKCRKVSEVRSLWKKPFFVLMKVVFAWYPLHEISLQMTKRLLHNQNLNSKYVGLVVGTTMKENQIIEREVWSEFQEINFEGHMFRAVKNCDIYLKREYGDYMKLPPEKDRVPKHDFYEMYWLENK